MRLVIGLGNPGSEYTGTRHNVGQEVIRACADHWKLEKRLFAEVAKKDDIVFALPTTFMNESGKAVQKITTTYHLPPTSLILVHDDIDLPLGTLRISQDSGAGGHNGVQSIIDTLGSKTFARLRIGVAGIGRKRTNAAAYVLKRFTKTELPAINETKKRAVEALSVIIRDGRAAAMQHYNAA